MKDFRSRIAIAAVVFGLGGLGGFAMGSNPAGSTQVSSAAIAAHTSQGAPRVSTGASGAGEHPRVNAPASAGTGTRRNAIGGGGRMTERPATDARAADTTPARSGKPRPLPTVLAALAIFAVVFEFLAFQLSAGRDPALGAGSAASAPVTKTRPAKKLVITKVIPAGGGAVGGSELQLLVLGIGSRRRPR